MQVMKELTQLQEVELALAVHVQLFPTQNCTQSTLDCVFRGLRKLGDGKGGLGGKGVEEADAGAAQLARSREAWPVVFVGAHCSLRLRNVHVVNSDSLHSCVVLGYRPLPFP